ncbi:MAG: hypothetical protein Q7W51_00615 [Coriobacteriia bacterium]|nr:hypothetical protein [Coriobacteriia bacterium]
MASNKPQRWEFARHAMGVAACLVLGLFGVMQGARIPILADASYGFHALGHLMSWFLPGSYAAMMGSAFQVLVPLGLAGYFLLFHRDLLGVSLMLAWTGVSAAETSVYIGDAVAQTIVPGLGHTGHDWAIVLEGLGKMGAVEELAFVAQAFAIVCILIGMGVAAWGAVKATFERETVEHADSFLERRPNFAPAEYDEWVRQQADGSAPAPPTAGF